MDVNREVGSRLVRSTGFLVGLQARALLLPWYIGRLWLVGCLNVVLAMVNMLGLMPSEYANRLKIKELNRHVDTMHQREEEYRRRIQTLTQQLEQQNKDKGKALKKLQRARADNQSLADALEGLQSMQEGSWRGPGGDGGGASVHNARLTHVLLWSAGAAAYLCSRSLSSLQQKLMMSVFIPVTIMYLQSETGHPGWRTSVIQCASAGILGFAINVLIA